MQVSHAGWRAISSAVPPKLAATVQPGSDRPLPPRIAVAIVVDWLARSGGAELVIRELLAAFPHATLFALFDVMPPADRAAITDRPARTSFMQHIPGIARRYRSLLPIMPFAIRSLDLSAFDLIISSNHAVAKGVRVREGQFHLCYCHSPMRYAWDMRDDYLADHGITGLNALAARVLLRRIRDWDRSSAAGVDRFVVNSHFVGERVRRNYGRESVVLHPPVDIDFFTPAGTHEPDLYVTASRQVAYKRIDRIVEAFRALPDRRLVVLGDGPEHDRIHAAAAGAPNISLLGEVPRTGLLGWFRKARAFVFAAEEDFGIVPLEAQACGTPVIALGRGGALETVRGEAGMDRTGLFFPDDSAASIAQAVRDFEALTVAPSASACRANAERFAAARFREGLLREVRDGWNAARANAER
ncbi:MAG: glycosyltransferase [Gemmatimonadetes bacterium]|nr:glycosyltransferase [Gemmatimonadota bacterium]